MTDGSGSTTNGFSLGDLLGCLNRHRVLALSVGTAMAVLVLLATLRTTPLYEATATLAVEPRGKALDFQVDPTSGKVEFSLLNTIRDKFEARMVVEKAMASCGLIDQPPYTSSTDPIQKASERLEIQTSKDSLSLKVRFRDEQPERGRRMLEALLQSFHDAQVATHSTRSSDALSFLARSKQEAEQQLAALRTREREMRQENDLVDDSPSDNIHAQRMRRLTDQLAVLTKERAAAKALMDQVQGARIADDPVSALLGLEVVARHPVVIEQRRLLYGLEDQQVLLAQKYLSKHPRMIEVEEQLAAKSRHLDEAVGMATAGVEARLQEVELQWTELQDQAQATESKLEEYRTRLVELGSLQKEVATTEKILDSLRQHMAEQQVLASLDANQATIIDPPTAGSEPVNIKKPLFAAAALFLGAIAATIAALSAELLSRKVRSLDRALDVTRMAVLGRMPNAPKLRPLAQDPQLDASERLGEAVRALRARIRLATRSHDGPRCIAVTSACPGDGKSTVAVHLAMSLAAAGDQVLLIDADLRQPRLDKEFEQETTEGLSAALRGAAIRPAEAPFSERLRYLGAGPIPSNPAELLHAPPLKHLLQDVARHAADWIIVDTPPLGRVSDALTIGELCDYVLLVVREDHTMRSDLRRSMSQLAPLEDKVLGMVYNAQTKTSEADLYAGYGSGGYGTQTFPSTRRIQAAGVRRPTGGTGPFYKD